MSLNIISKDNYNDDVNFFLEKYERNLFGILRTHIETKIYSTLKTGYINKL